MTHLYPNIKVIDTKSTLKEPSDYVSEVNEGLKNNIPKEDIEMFIFDTWGERSIVKSQNLSVKLPSSFQSYVQSQVYQILSLITHKEMEIVFW